MGNWLVVAVMWVVGVGLTVALAIYIVRRYRISRKH